jgi:hypothetical protein
MNERAKALKEIEEEEEEQEEESGEESPAEAESQVLALRAAQLLEGISDSGTYNQRSEVISTAQAWATLASVAQLRALGEKLTTFETSMAELVKELD